MNRSLLSLACLSLFFPSPSQADDQPGPSEVASGSVLPFRLSSGYLIQVEGRIGDQPHLKFILDTGASISIVSQRMARILKLDARPAQSFNFDRNLQWEAATIPEIQYGPIRAANVAVLVGDLARYSEFAGKADAIIGMDLLGLSDFTIDYGAGDLIFDPVAPRTYLAGGDPMTRCLIVQLQVQDRPVRMIVDTGLQGVVLYEERLRKTVPGLRPRAVSQMRAWADACQLNKPHCPMSYSAKRTVSYRWYSFRRRLKTCFRESTELWASPRCKLAACISIFPGRH